jgi:hypothetical protein
MTTMPIRVVELDIDMGIGEPLTVSTRTQERTQGTTFQIPGKNTPNTEATFPEGKPFKIHVSSDYMGHILIQHKSKTLLRFELKSFVNSPINLEPVRVYLRRATPAPTNFGFPSSQPWSPPQGPWYGPNTSSSRSFSTTSQPSDLDDIYVFAAQIPTKLKQGLHDVATASEETLTWLAKTICPSKTLQTGAGIANTLYDVRHILKDHGARFYLKKHKNGNIHVVFRGVKGLRKYLTGTRFLLDNPKIISLTGGTTSIVKGATQGLKSLKSAPAKVNLIFCGIVDVVSWMNDGDKPFTDLLVDLGMGVAKGLLSSALSSGLVAGAMGLIVTAGAAISVPIWLVIGATIVLGIGINMVLDELDERFQITQKTKSFINESKDNLRKDFNRIVREFLAQYLAWTELTSGEGTFKERMKSALRIPDYTDN